MKLKTLSVWLGVVICVAGSCVYWKNARNKERQECEVQLRCLWEGGRSHCVAYTKTYSDVLRVQDLRAYVKNGEQGLHCPTTKDRYEDFCMFDGPRCRSHPWDTELLRQYQTRFKLLSMAKDGEFKMVVVTNAMHDRSDVVRFSAIECVMGAGVVQSSEVMEALRFVALTSRGDEVKSLATQILNTLTGRQNGIPQSVYEMPKDSKE